MGVRIRALGEVRLTIATHLWLHWLRIGVEHARAAEAARAELMQCRPEDTGSSPAIAAEMHASMVGVAAAAFAIDALYGEVKDLVSVPQETRDRWNNPDDRTARPSVIFETFKMGCKLGDRTREWPPRLKALFDLRDPAVHHRLTRTETVPHPSGRPFNVGKEFGDYSLEVVRSSLELAFDVALTVLRHPKSSEMQAWAERMGHVPTEVEAVRSRLSAPPVKPASLPSRPG